MTQLVHTTDKEMAIVLKNEITDELTYDHADMIHDSENGPVEESDLYDQWISSRRSSNVSQREKKHLKSDRKKWGSRKEREEKRLGRIVLAREARHTLSARERRHLEYEKKKLPFTKARANEAQDKREPADINEYDEGEAADRWNGDQGWCDDWSYSNCRSNDLWTIMKR